MVIHLATDHAGFEHKQAIAAWLEHEGMAVVDHGSYVYQADDDFPDFISQAALAVSKNPQTECAIIFGGSGTGEAIMANRLANVRTVVLYADVPEIIALSREHNNTNVLSVGARFVSVDVAKKHIWEWLHTNTTLEEKYQRRNQKIEAITKSFYS